jgi:cell division septation protein DedD
VTRDYKNRAAPRESSKARRPCLFWFAAGVLAGAFAVGLMWLQLDPALSRSGSKLAGTGVPRPKPDDSPRAPVIEGLEFEFPELLRKMEVLLPGDEERAVPDKPAISVAPPPPPPEPVARPTPQTVPRPAATEPPAVVQPVPPKATRAAPAVQAYLLQLGSFRAAADAERLKARLALMGVESYIQKVTINGKDTYHRVRSGPYRNQARLDEVRRLLTRNSIDSIIVRWTSG